MFCGNHAADMVHNHENVNYFLTMEGLAMVTTFRQLLDLWPHRDQVAGDLNVTYSRVDSWHRRGRVPPEFWAGLIASAVKRDIPGIDLVMLSMLPQASGCRTHADIIDLWPSRDLLAKDLRIPSATVRSWRVRNNIPADVWDAMVTASLKHGVTGLNRGIFEATRHPPEEQS
jgi:hypothetical protein